MASPYGPQGASQVSRDGKIAFATVNFDAQAQDLPAAAVNAVIHTAQAARGPDLKVELAGQAIENAQPQKSSDSTALGVILALIVLGLAFGALFAAITPLVTALVAIGIGYALTGLLSHVLAIVSFAPILGVLVGNIIIQQFGVGLAAAVIIDAFIVRTTLVRALMRLSGRANWWLPGWLDRRLPHLTVDVPGTPPSRDITRVRDRSAVVPSMGSPRAAAGDWRHTS